MWDPFQISLPAATGDVGLGEDFGFPFQTIEDVVVLGPTYLGVLNDNNFPFSVGRHVGSGAPDDEEMIVIDVGLALWLPQAERASSPAASPHSVRTCDR
jgi:glycerophosphoryl diester phosphodiesterase